MDQKKYRVYLTDNANKTTITTALQENHSKSLPVMLLPDYAKLFLESHVNTVAIVINAIPALVGGYPYEPDDPENEPSPGQIIGFIEAGEMPEPLHTGTIERVSPPTLTIEDGQFFVNVPQHFLPKHLRDKVTWERANPF